MQYETKEALSKAIEEYSNYFLEIPDNFDVKHEYLLGGISQVDFIKAYKKYRDLIYNIYQDIASNPEEYDFVKPDKKGNFKNTQQPIQCIMWMMYALGKAGDVKDSVLVVSSELLENIFTGKHECILTYINNKLINRKNLLTKLEMFGFYNDPHVAIVMKAHTMSWYANESFNCDFSGFNYKVFSVGQNENLPYDDLYIARLATEEQRNYMNTVIMELDKLGYKCNNIRFHSFNSNVWMYRCCHFYQRDGKIYMNIPLHYVPKQNRQTYLDHLAAMPERYRSRMRCHGKCRKECGTRVIEIVDGKKMAFCSPNLILHNLNKIEDIPYIVELIKVSFKPKSK